MSDFAWIFGLHAVRTLLTQHPGRASLLLLQKGREDERVAEVSRLAQAADIRIEWRDARELAQMIGSDHHQGVCLQIRPMNTLGEGALDDILDACVTPPLLLVLDGVQDPHNLGACLRTADAAGATAVVVPKDRAAGLSPAVRKVASGAAETMPLIQVTNLARTLRWLQQRGIWITGTEGDATTTLYDVELTGPSALVLGAEGSGLRRLTRENCDALASIPMHGVVESLNVSVAAAVALYEAVRQRGTAPRGARSVPPAS